MKLDVPRPGSGRHRRLAVGRQNGRVRVEGVDHHLVGAQVRREDEVVVQVVADHVGVGFLLAARVDARARVLDDRRRLAQGAVVVHGKGGHGPAAVIGREHGLPAAVHVDGTGAGAPGGLVVQGRERAGRVHGVGEDPAVRIARLAHRVQEAGVRRQAQEGRVRDAAHVADVFHHAGGGVHVVHVDALAGGLGIGADEYANGTGAAGHVSVLLYGAEVRLLDRAECARQVDLNVPDGWAGMRPFLGGNALVFGFVISFANVYIMLMSIVAFAVMFAVTFVVRPSSGDLRRSSGDLRRSSGDLRRSSGVRHFNKKFRGFPVYPD